MSLLSTNSQIERLNNIVGLFSRLSDSKHPIIPPLSYSFNKEELECLNSFTEKQNLIAEKLSLVEAETIQIDAEIESINHEIIEKTKKVNALASATQCSGGASNPSLVSRMNEEMRFMRINTDIALCKLRNIQREDY